MQQLHKFCSKSSFHDKNRKISHFVPALELQVPMGCKDPYLIPNTRPVHKSSIRAPVFSRNQHSAPRSITEKLIQVLLFGWMICNNAICCWPYTSCTILIVFHNSVKGGLKVIDCIVLSAKYWCPYGIHIQVWTKIISMIRLI